MTTTIFTARTVITMNPALPRAEAVAVRNGRIVGIGTLDELAGRGEHVVDTTFADHVLTSAVADIDLSAFSNVVPLGSGGLGDVYRGTRTSTGGEVPWLWKSTEICFYGSARR